MDCVIRVAVAADAELLAEARFRQLLDEGSELRFDTRADMVDYFRRNIALGLYRAYIAEAEGRLVSTAAMLLQEYPPSISWNGARRGYVTGVYTVPERRGQGLASALLGSSVLSA